MNTTDKMTGLVRIKCLWCEKYIGFLCKRRGDPFKVPEDSKRVVEFMATELLFMICESCAPQKGHKATVNLKEKTVKLDDEPSPFGQ